MSRKLVSIIMPVKNGEPYLRQSIESILNQDYPELELIIVDGQSTDQTEQIARSYKQIQYIKQTKQPGIPQAKNLGLEFARGEFIAFASHDDLWAPHKLNKQIQFMTENDLQYSITLVRFFLEPGCEIKPGFNSELLKNDYVGKMPETLAARRSLFDYIGKFTTELNFMEDIDWFTRADRHNVRMGVIEEVLLYKRIHDTNVSYDSLKIMKIKSEIFSLLKKSIDNKI